MTAPEFRTISFGEFADEAFEVVHEDIDTWRHGTVHLVVLKDDAGRFWAASYRCDKDGDYNDWRDDEPNQKCPEVFPHTASTVVFKTERPA